MYKQQSAEVERWQKFNPDVHGKKQLYQIHSKIDPDVNSGTWF